MSIPSRKCLILDLGDDFVRVGFADDENPRLTIPSVLGYTKSLDMDKIQQPFYAEEAIIHSSEESLQLTYPLQGKLWNWAGVMELISYFYQQLGIESSDYPILYIEPSNANPQNTDKLVDVLKNEYSVPGIYVIKSQELVLKAMYRRSALIVNFSYSSHCTIRAFYQGFEISSAFNKFNFNSILLLEEINKLIESETGSRRNIYEIIPILEDKFYIAKTYNNEIQYLERGFVEPVQVFLDKNEIPIQIGKYAFEVPEILFQPSLRNIEGESLIDIIYQAIMKSTIDTRTDILENIILTGPLSKLKGLDFRIKNELTKLFPSLLIKMPVKHLQSDLTHWIGATIIAQKGIPSTTLR